MNLGEVQGQEEVQFCGKRFLMKHDLVIFAILTKKVLMPAALLSSQLGVLQHKKGKQPFLLVMG